MSYPLFTPCDKLILMRKKYASILQNYNLAQNSLLWLFEYCKRFKISYFKSSFRKRENIQSALNS